MFRPVPRILVHAGLVGLAAAFCFLASAHVAVAQDPADAERLHSEIERTDQILERASAVVEQHGNQRARNQLRFAFQLQETAKSIERSATASVFDLRRSIELTRRARLLAERAVYIASQQAHLEQRAQQLLDRLDRQLQEARALAGDAPDPRVQRTLELGHERLERAREAFHEQRFQEVIGMSVDTSRLLDDFVRPNPKRQLERMLENTRHLLERAEDDLQENFAGLELLQRAATMLDDAEAHLIAGREAPAERLLQQARELVLRAMRLGETPLDPSGVDLALEELAQFIDLTAPRVQESGSGEAVALLETARTHLDRARTLRLEGKLHQALEEARVARNLTGRAAQLAENPEP
jgi:hypothetical protein